MICDPDLCTAFRPYDTTCEYSGFRNMVYLPRAPRSPLPCHKLSEEPLEARGGGRPALRSRTFAGPASTTLHGGSSPGGRSPAVHPANSIAGCTPRGGKGTPPRSEAASCGFKIGGRRLANSPSCGCTVSNLIQGSTPQNLIRGRAGVVRNSCGESNQLQD